jgi:hypothetical protein
MDACGCIGAEQKLGETVTVSAHPQLPDVCCIPCTGPHALTPEAKGTALLVR